MSDFPSTYNEIDLLSLIETVWEGKWKILSIIAVSLLSVFGFNILKPNTSFIWITLIIILFANTFFEISQIFYKTD